MMEREARNSWIRHPEAGIETYPVGFFFDLKHRNFKRGARHLKRHITARNWGAIRSYFNGYLAEWHYVPDGVRIRKCGRGWTRQAARRRLGREIVTMNLSYIEQSR